MTVHIALLRAVNVAGQNKVAMADLRDLLVDLGMSEVTSLLQSGNLVFRARGGNPSKLERRLETEAERRLGLQTDFLVRTAPDMAEIVASNPFPDEARLDPSHLLVMFMKTAPVRTRLAELEEAIPGRERFRCRGQQLYIVYPDGIGRSRLTTRRIEESLGMRGTGRNWNTVSKLEALARSV